MSTLPTAADSKAAWASAVQASAVQASAVQASAVQASAVQASAVDKVETMQRQALVTRKFGDTAKVTHSENVIVRARHGHVVARHSYYYCGVAWQPCPTET